MHTIAKSLNDQISGVSKEVYDMLSNLGKELYIPNGILTQGIEAKEKAHKLNATIGIATTENGPMYLECIYNKFNEFTPDEVFNYAPSDGIKKLRQAWKEKMVKDNPLLEGKKTSLPVVTNAITHGLSTASDMFIDEGDFVIIPDKFWGNYRMIMAVRRGAEIVSYPIFTEDNKYNVVALIEKVRECSKARNKVIVVLNFPHNPTGYTPSAIEMNAIANGLAEIAESGTKVIVLIDDAYFGLFFDDTCFKESIFALLAERSKNLLAIKLDGATKEEFVWGLRVGFITFSIKTEVDATPLYHALEVKVAGLIRGTISNGPRLSQEAVYKSIKNPDFYAQRARCNDILKYRCDTIRSILARDKYKDEFTAYPFNSGYFMCIKLLRVDAEQLRQYLLNNYGVGVISMNSTDVRLAFSTVEERHLEELFEIIYKGCKELQQQ